MAFTRSGDLWTDGGGLALACGSIGHAATPCMDADHPREPRVTELPSPRAARLATPRWLNGRLVAGVLLVLLSVLTGVRVVAAADRSSSVVTVTRDLAAGTILTPDDLGVAQVRLRGNGDRYAAAAGPSPVGRVLTRPMSRRELLPLDAVADPRSLEPSRLVTVPVGRLHAPPDLARGQLVDVLATYGGSGQPGRTVPVLRAVPVQAVDRGASTLTAGGSEFAVVLRVAPDRVSVLVAALQSASLDVVRVEPGATVGDIGASSVPTGSESASVARSQSGR